MSGGIPAQTAAARTARVADTPTLQRLHREALRGGRGLLVGLDPAGVHLVVDHVLDGDSGAVHVSFWVKVAGQSEPGHLTLTVPVAAFNRLRTVDA